MHNVGFPSTLCLALVIVPLLASVATSYPSPEFEELENPVAELPDKRGWTNFNGGYGKRGWNSFQGGYGKRAFDYVSTVDHHSLEYGPSNKNLFQTMGVFHTMGGFI